jgi:DNA repair exonuclease SbcCD ATPase subunit
MADIQEKFAQLFAQLAELTEQQKTLGEQAQKAEEQLEKASDAKASEAAEQKLDALQQKQNELNAKLNKLADTMDEFVRKEPIYDVETDLQKVLDEQAQKIRESTQANQQAQELIAQQTSPPQGGRQMSPQDAR